MMQAGPAAAHRRAAAQRRAAAHRFDNPASPRHRLRPHADQHPSDQRSRPAGRGLGRALAARDCTHHHRPADARRSAAGGVDRQRPRAARGRSGARQDVVLENASGGHAGALPAPPVHARHATRGHRRHADLQPAGWPLRHQARADLHQSGTRRRDQPRTRKGPERPARGHAGAPGDDRRPDLPATRALHGHGDPEPDRAGGHLPAARGTGRPLHVEGRGRVPDQAGGAADPRPDGDLGTAAGDQRRARSGAHPGSPPGRRHDLRRRQGEGLHRRDRVGDARARGVQARSEAVHPLRRIATRDHLLDPGREGLRVSRWTRLRHAAGREEHRHGRAAASRGGQLRGRAENLRSEDIVGRIFDTVPVP